MYVVLLTLRDIIDSNSLEGSRCTEMKPCVLNICYHPNISDRQIV